MTKQFYAGAEEYIDFFNEVIEALGLEHLIQTETIIVDGEYEMKVSSKI